VKIFNDGGHDTVNRTVLTFVAPPSAVMVKVMVVTPDDVVNIVTVLSLTVVYNTEPALVNPVPVGT
jgi:hypothetical protein